MDRKNLLLAAADTLDGFLYVGSQKLIETEIGIAEKAVRSLQLRAVLEDLWKAETWVLLPGLEDGPRPSFQTGIPFHTNDFVIDHRAKILLVFHGRMRSHPPEHWDQKVKQNLCRIMRRRRESSHDFRWLRTSSERGR